MQPHRPDSVQRESGAPSAKRGRRDTATLDTSWLENEAIRYVARWESTRHGVRDVLERRLEQRCARTGEDPESLRSSIPAVVDRLAERGYVDDRRFAENMIERSRRQGRSRSQIHAQLRAKGVDSSIVRELEQERTERRAREGAPSIGEVSSTGLDSSPGFESSPDRESAELPALDEDLEAAWRTARKRRLGPYCLDPAERSERRQRHLGVLARQGFSREIAYRVVDADSPPDLSRRTEP
jgi:regulatory protein